MSKKENNSTDIPLCSLRLRQAGTLLRIARQHAACLKTEETECIIRSARRLTLGQVPLEHDAQVILAVEGRLGPPCQCFWATVNQGASGGATNNAK